MNAVFSLFGWLPLPLQFLCNGAIAIFLLIGVYRLISFLFGLLSFLRR